MLPASVWPPYPGTWGSPVAAGVVGDLQLRAVLTAQHMATQFGTATTFDGGHDLELAQAQMTDLCLTPCGTLSEEDIRDLQRAGHGPAQAGGSSDKASRGLRVSRKVVVAT